jgi:hypothetical protein
LTGCALWDLAVLFGNQEVRIYGLKRDADLEDEILSRAAEWWERHVVADVAPEPTCIADVKSLYARVTDTTIDADEMLIHWSHVAEDAAKKSGEYQSVADTAKMHLLAAMRDAAVLRLDGNRAFRRKVIHKKEYVVEATSYVDARLTTLRNEK